MKLRKEFFKYLFGYSVGTAAVILLYNYFASEGPFILEEQILEPLFIGAFTSVLVYFNHFTLKGEKRYPKKKRRAEGSRN